MKQRFAGIFLLLIGYSFLFIGCPGTSSNPTTPTNPTSTFTPFYTYTITQTPTITLSPTVTSSPTITNTPTITATLTVTSTPTVNIYLIDDLEDGDTSIIPIANRSGNWFANCDSLGTSVDGATSGTTILVRSPGYQSSYCAAITGTLAMASGSTTPWAQMVLSLGSYNINANMPGSTGVAFDIKTVISGSCFQPRVRFQISDNTTNSSSDFNGVNMNLTPGNWQAVTVYFNQMMTEGWGVTQTHVLDVTTLGLMQWEIYYPGIQYDIAVDNVQFVTDVPPASSVPPAWPSSLIDNMDSNLDGLLLKNAGRNGFWYSTDNSTADTLCPLTGTGMPILQFCSGGDSISPQSCARITGIMGAGGWPLVDLDFLQLSGGYDQLYNAKNSPGGPYTGIQFYAKVGSGSVTTVYVEMPDATTDPNISSPNCGSWCNADHGAIVNLTTAWAPYQVSFSNMTNPWGSNPATTVDPTQVVGIRWQIHTGGWPQVDSGAYDLWVDDVNFY